MVSSNHVNTAIGGITAVTLAPDVAWALEGFHGAIPANAPGLVAAGLIWAIHYAYNRWLAPKGASSPS
ncbi:MAG: hypothetical protein ACLPKW_14815 [Acetobacteraceae bacterium]